MRVARLDLGADVVHVPTRDLLVIHPDLGYTEALGAVMGTLPHLHIDVARGLVEQVTQRPRWQPWYDRLAPAVARVGTAVVIATMATLAVFTPAAAEAEFGQSFRAQMEALGLTCEDRQDGDSTQHCYDADHNVHLVRGYTRKDASLYVVDNDAGQRISVLIFDNARAASEFRDRHPEVSMTGRAAVW